MAYRTIIITFFFAMLIIVLPACTTQRASFAGHDPDQVWTALVAVARTPDYSSENPSERWTVRENDVWVDDENSRIEIHRRLERDLYRPAARHLHEDREWRIQVALEDRDPPTVRFSTRQMDVPARGWDEADRFFNDVQAVLDGERSLAPSQPSASGELPATQPAKKPVDIRELEPTKP